MDSLADRRIDAGAAESLWVMAPENEWLGTYFHVGARPLFRSEMLLVSVRSVPPKYHSPAKESHRVARRNQLSMMMKQNILYAGRTPPTLCKRLIFGAPVCRIPKIDPTWLAHIVSKVLVVERPPTIRKNKLGLGKLGCLKNYPTKLSKFTSVFLLKCHRPTGDLTTTCCHLLRPGNLIVWRLLSASWASMIPKCWRRWVFTGDGWSSVVDHRVFGVPLAAFCLLRAGKPWKFRVFGSCFF